MTNEQEPEGVKSEHDPVEGSGQGIATIAGGWVGPVVHSERLSPEPTTSARWVVTIERTMPDDEIWVEHGTSWIGAKEAFALALSQMADADIFQDVQEVGGRPGGRGVSSQADTSGQTQTEIPPTDVNGEGKSE